MNPADISLIQRVRAPAPAHLVIGNQIVQPGSSFAMATRYQWVGLRSDEWLEGVQRRFGKKHQEEPKPTSPFDVARLEVGCQKYEFELDEQGLPVSLDSNRLPEFTLRKRILSNGRISYEIMNGFFQDGEYFKGEHPTIIDGRRIESGRDKWYGLGVGSTISIGMTTFIFYPPAEPFTPKAKNFLEALYGSFVLMKKRTWEQGLQPIGELENLFESLNGGDWASSLKILADLPNIPVLETRVDFKGAMMSVSHRSHSGYLEALDHLVELTSKGIEEGMIRGMTREEARVLGRNARGSIDEKENKGPDLAKRLKEAGCPQPKDCISSLKFLLEHPRYRPLDFQGDNEELPLDFEPDYEKLIMDTVTAIPYDHDKRDSLGIQEILRKRGFGPSGKRFKFPVTQTFFAEHFPNAYWVQEEFPLSMLRDLIFPDMLRGDGKKDPLTLPGYREAVYELGRALLRLKNEGNLGEDHFALLEIPNLQVPDILRKELTRLIQSPGFEEQLAEMIQRGKEDTGPLGKKEIQEAESRSGFSPKGTMHYLYSRQIKGGKQISESLPPDFKFTLGEEAKKNGAGHWIYAGTFFEKEDDLGRFYFAVRPECAGDFWNEMKEIFEKAAENGREFQAKISTDPKRFSAGDGTLLYFLPKDQLYFRIQALKVIEAHPEWFHDTRPIFTARIKDLKGEFVRGLSFGQDPRIPGASYNSHNASALLSAVRRVRFWTLMGAKIPPEKILQFMADHLQRYGVDIFHPAFQLGQNGKHPGIVLFEDLFKVSDQI